MNAPTLFGLCGAVLVGLGLYGLVVNPQPLRKILAFNLVGSGVFLLFGVVARRGAALGMGGDPVPQALVITGIVVAVYVLWVGADLPGGKFQAGTLLAAMWLLAIMAGLTEAPPISRRWLRGALVAGTVVFLAIGFAGVPLAGAFLAYPEGFAKPLIVAIEAASMLSIAFTLALLVLGPPERSDQA